MTHTDQEYTVRPVGIVHAESSDPLDVPVHGRLKPAYIEIFPEYSQALLRIEENSHLWILLWFHQSDRSILSTTPTRINPDLPEYGVFSLRAPHRPNPIALTRVKLDQVKDRFLYISGLDAIDGTPVLDIKPYFEGDIVFEPRTPHIRPHLRAMRQEHYFKQALEQHKETCTGFWIGLRMALIAEEHLGHLNREDLFLEVTGSRCLGDVLQGISRARLANPARFTFIESNQEQSSRWFKANQKLEITARKGFTDEDWQKREDDELFTIIYQHKS